ncbi:MAG: hypothetical protein U1E84_10485 [Rhodoferax sp.]
MKPINSRSPLAAGLFALLLAGCIGGGSSTDVAVTQADIVAPQGLQAVSTQTGVALSWTASFGAAAYNVARCDIPSSSPITDLCQSAEATSCKTIATVSTTTHVDVPASTSGHCYRVQACTDGSGKKCGYLNDDSKHGNVNPAAQPVVYFESPARTYSEQQTILHGYARNVPGTVTYEWRLPDGVSVCPGKTKTETDLCFVAPKVTANQLMAFELVANSNGAFLVKGKTSITAEPVGNVLVATQDTRVVQPGQTVSLHVQGAGGSQYSWVQTGPVAPSTGQIPTALRVTLTGATTATPTFVAPAGIDTNQLQFAVTYTDATTGKTTTQTYAIGGRAAATAATGQPLQTAQSGTPSPTGVIAPSIAPQPLTLVAPPPAQVVGGSPVALTMTAAHGSTASPYRWQWTQKGGISVSSTLQGASTSLVKFTAPTVTAAQEVVFEVTVSDGTTTRTGQAVVRVIPTPTATPPAPGATPSVKVNTPLRLSNIPSPNQITPNKVVTFGTTLKNVQVAQVSGYTCANLKATANADGSGSTITCTAPRLPVDTATLRFEVSGITSVGVAAKEIQDVQVTEPFPIPAAQAPALVTPPPAPSVPEPLHATNCGQQQAQGGQPDDVILGICVSGGTGVYQYAWTFAAAQPRGVGADSITLRDATTKNPRFTAPAVTAAKVALGFTVKVTDAGNPSATQALNIAHTLYNVGGTNPGSTAQTVTVGSGQTVTLHLPAPFGGTPPYTYSLDSVKDSNGATVGGMTQGSGPGCPGSGCSNWVFTPPTPAAGTTVTYTATYTTTDAAGTRQTDTTQVTVKAPAATTGVASAPGAPTPEPAPVGPTVTLPSPPAALTASISAADPAATARGLTIQGAYANKAVASNTIEFINWTLTCQEALPDRHPINPDTGTPVSPGTICPGTTERLLTASGDGSAVTLNALPFVEKPATASGGGGLNAGTATKTMTVKVTVVEKGTWPNGDALVRLAKAEKTITVRSVKKGSSCYTCGDYNADPRKECSRIDIITRHKETCSDATPYCMNDIFQAAGETPKLYKRCVNEADAKELWFMQSSDKVACFHYDSSTFRDDLVCHLACYGDDCNANALPPQDSLYHP